MLEHDYEESPGLPEALPGGERLLWQGGPSFASFARGSFHLPKLAVYFGILIVLQFGLALAEGTAPGAAVASTTGFVILAAIALGLLATYAWLAARSAMFTITNRRVVLRTGVAVPVSFNLPFSKIQSADLRLHKDGSGDIVLVPERGSRVSWLLLWPMVKPWRFLRVRPVLRGIDDAAVVAELLAAELIASVDTEDDAPVSAAAEAPKPAPSTGSRRWRPYPAVPLAGMVSLVVISLVGATFAVLNDDGRDAASPVPLVASVDLYFEDHEDGSVVVREAGGGTVIDVLDPGTNGFVRATLRTLANARGTLGAGAEEPFTVGINEAGRVLLIDPVSAREIDLRAFGPTNAEAFARYLEDDLPVTGEASNAADGAETTIALQQKESTP